jgi:hypothetical protein
MCIICEMEPSVPPNLATPLPLELSLRAITPPSVPKLDRDTGGDREGRRNVITSRRRSWLRHPGPIVDEKATIYLRRPSPPTFSLLIRLVSCTSLSIFPFTLVLYALLTAIHSFLSSSSPSQQRRWRWRTLLPLLWQR